VEQLLFLHLVMQWFPLWLHETKKTGIYLTENSIIDKKYIEKKQEISIKYLISSLSMLFVILPGGTAVVSFPGAAVLFCLAT